MFSGGNIQRIESYSEADNDDSNDDNDDDEKEELEVVDFNDVGKLFEQTRKRKKSSSKKSSVELVENQFIGAHSILHSPTSSLHRPQRDLTDLGVLTRKRIDENASAAEKSQEDDVASTVASQFYIDTQPTPIPAEMAPSTLLSSPDEFDDDIIVYVAPHPRKGTQTSPERHPSTNEVPDTSEFTPYVRDASFSLAVASSSSTKATIEEETTQSQPLPQPQIEIPSILASPLSFPTPEGTRGRHSVPPVTISRLAISRKRKKGVLRKKGGKGTRNSFRAFGAMREEAQLHDPKWKERRRGDSDLDWGDTDGSDDDYDDSGGKRDHIEVDDVASPSGLEHGNGDVIGKDKGKGKGKAREPDNGHGMEVDSDLDLHAMQHFVDGLLGEDAGRHVTMDDLRDEAEEEKRRLEKEDDTGEDSRDINDSLESGGDESSEDEDAELERVLADEEAMLISETLEFEDEDVEEDDGSEDEDEDQTPRTSFQQRLERLRKQASSSKHGNEHDISDDDDDDGDDMLERHMLFAEKDDFGFNKVWVNFWPFVILVSRFHRKPINTCQSYFDFPAGSDEEIDYFNRKSQSCHFFFVSLYSFLSFVDMTVVESKRSKAADLPDDLKILWEKDRLKKAAFKKARYEARLEAAADPLSKKKGGKKGRKAMLTVASIDPTITVLPNRIIDMVTLVQQIRRFIDDEERETMSLPPTNKATRKNIHELALAFNVKSISKGNGDARYTTLSKTWRTGVLDVDEGKVAKIARRKNHLRDELFVRGNKKTRGDSFFQDKKGKKSKTGGQALVPHNREGEEVGKVKNFLFKMQ